MLFNFRKGQQYSRRDVYRIIGINEDTKGGNWDTGLRAAKRRLVHIL